ncbi:MAG: PepSY domain-containing protein [Kibdelosporangium sp.]
MLKLTVAALAAAAALTLTACGAATPTNASLAGQLTTTSEDSTTEATTETSTGSATVPPASSDDSSTTATEPAPEPAMDPPARVDHRRIALDRVGGGQVTKVERELEHGRTEWKYRIVHNGQTYDVRVDATSGGITRFESKK